MFSKILVAVLLLQGLICTWQSPLFVKYDSEILRTAKASQISNFLDSNVNPCDNFYQFACGKWSYSHPATEKTPKTSYLELLDDYFERKSTKMLESNLTIDTEVDLKVKDFFKSCLNRPTLQELDLEPIKKIVDFKGGWPKLENPSWYESEYDWLHVVAKLRRKLGVNIFIGLDIVPDISIRGKQSLKIGAPKLALWGHNTPDERDDFQDMVEVKLSIFLPEMSRDWIEEVAQQVIDIETQLLKGVPSNTKLTFEQTTKFVSVDKMKENYGQYVDVARYLHEILDQKPLENVYESPQDYFSNLVEVIKNTPKLKIANYTMYKVLDHFISEINPHELPNDYWCSLKVAEYFPKQLRNMFHRNYKEAIMINELQSIWEDIKTAFIEKMRVGPELSWIATNNSIRNRLNSMVLQFPKSEETSSIDELYNLVIMKSYYWHNLINTMEWKTKQDLANLYNPPQEQVNHAQTPKYIASTNRIEVPITFLQSRFFSDPVYPNALNFSSLGFLMAREMLHAFDLGIRNNKLNPTGAKTNSEYNAKGGCFANQYRNYNFNEVEVADENALVTSIDDSGALDIVYRAYNKWINNLNEVFLSKENLPDLKFTRYQLFYIGFAQTFCADYHKSLRTLHELPEEIRVNNAISNNQDFALVFNCNANTKMNPAQKCALY